MSHRIVELQHLPEGMASMPSIQRVAEWYMDSVHELVAHPIPVDFETEKSMTRLIEAIYGRHSKTLVTMARGVAEFKRELGYQPTDMLPDHLEDPLTQFLNGFYSSRIGIRTLIEQHVALHHPRPGHVGIINCHTHPVAICRDAADEAAIMCERELGASPLVEIIGDSDFSFKFIDSHMHHVMFEILKNAFRAVVERHGEDAELPPVTVVVATDSSAEDVAIKVSDQGGGIPRSAMKRVWSYFYTSSSSGALDAFEDGADFSTNTPLAGLGYGLPLSRVYARYFGGDLSIVPMQNYGTDAFVFLKRVGDAMELDPPIIDLSNATPE
jgi:pyruvate dehydrogenase kinase 2/3/4